MGTREKLINSALKLFNEKGFEKTSTTSICLDAWFSSGALFVHFKTKNDLLDGLYLSIKNEYIQYVFWPVNESLNTLDEIRLLLKRSFEFYINNHEKYVFKKNFAGSNHISRIAKEEVENEMTRFYQLLDKWKKEWSIIDEKNEILLSMLWSIFYSFVDHIYVRKEQHNYEKYINLILRSILVAS